MKMTFFQFIRNGLYLILFTFLAFLGLKYGLSGLIINLFNNDVHKITTEELSDKGAGMRRYIEVLDWEAWDLNMAYFDSYGKPVSYLYCLSLPDTSKSKTMVVVVESNSKIEDFSDIKISGILKPFWYKPDEEIVALIEEYGFKMAENNYFLQLNEKPRKWYYNLIILIFSALFLYRFIEFITKRAKEKNPEG